MTLKAVESIEYGDDFVIRNACGKTSFRFRVDGEHYFSLHAFQDSILLTDEDARELIDWLRLKFT